LPKAKPYHTRETPQSSLEEPIIAPNMAFRNKFKIKDDPTGIARFPIKGTIIIVITKEKATFIVIGISFLLKTGAKDAKLKILAKTIKPALIAESNAGKFFERSIRTSVIKFIFSC
jgi:hypothetical protein